MNKLIRWSQGTSLRIFAVLTPIISGATTRGAKGAEPPPPQDKEKMKVKAKMKKIFGTFYSPGKLDFCWPINMHKLEIILIEDRHLK